MYTIIGHVRFYEPNALDKSLPPTKIDACTGLKRTVTALAVVTTPVVAVVVEEAGFPVAGIAGIAAGVI